MGRVIYDFSGLDGLAELLQLEIKDGRYRIVPGRELAEKNPVPSSRNVAILADNFFSAKEFTDDSTLAFIERVQALDVVIVYIGVERDTSEFASKLRSFGVIYALETSETLDGEVLIKLVNKAIDQVEVIKYDADKDEPAKDDTLHMQTNKREPNIGKTHTCILISGASGIGTTFVGANLASFLAQKNETSYYECGLRPVLTTWAGADEEAETSATLHESVIQKGDLNIYSRNPFGEGDIPIREIVERIRNKEGNHILDLALQDYIVASERELTDHDVRILVTNADYHRLRYLDGVPADVVVVNAIPSRLPFDESEFQAFWPSAKIVFVPYVEDQSAYIAEAEFATEKSEVLTDALSTITSIIEGRDFVEDSIAG